MTNMEHEKLLETALLEIRTKARFESENTIGNVLKIYPEEIQRVVHGSFEMGAERGFIECLQALIEMRIKI